MLKLLSLNFSPCGLSLGAMGVGTVPVRQASNQQENGAGRALGLVGE